MTIAQNLLKQFGEDLESNIDLLGINAIENTYDYDNDTTTFYFKDGSSIRFDSTGFICETDLETIIVSI